MPPPSLSSLTVWQSILNSLTSPRKKNHVNTNTNYNSDAEAAAGLFGMRAIARYLGQQLHDLNV
jgi:hypothetical protein